MPARRSADTRESSQAQPTSRRRRSIRWVRAPEPRPLEEVLQRHAQLLMSGRASRRLRGNNHVKPSKELRQLRARQFAQAPPDEIAFVGPHRNALTDDEAEAGDGQRIRHPLQAQQRIVEPPAGPSNAGEIVTAADTVLSVHSLHNRQALSPLHSAGLEDALAGTTRHPLQEAVLAPARNALRLPRSLHVSYTLLSGLGIQQPVSVREWPSYGQSTPPASRPRRSGKISMATGRR